jgi:ATP-dependent protease Clp ATPase subunit
MTDPHGRQTTMTIKASYYSVIFQNIIKNMPTVPRDIAREIDQALTALDQNTAPEADLLEAVERPFYTRLHELSRASARPGERYEAYAAIMALLEEQLMEDHGEDPPSAREREERKFLAGRPREDRLGANELSVMTSLQKLVSGELRGFKILTRGVTDGQVPAADRDTQLTRYQKITLALATAAVESGEYLTIIAGPAGAGRKTVARTLAQMYQMASIHCADPLGPNMPLHQLNHTLAKLSDETVRRGLRQSLAVITGLEVLFPGDQSGAGRLAIPANLRIVATVDTSSKLSGAILADDMRHFGRKAAVIDLPAPTRAQLLEALATRWPRLDGVIDQIAATGGALSFTTVLRAAALGRHVTTAEAVAVTLGRTATLFAEPVDRTPKAVLEAIRRRVFAQDDAVAAVGQILKRNHAGLKPDGRLAGAFLFAGPTGTGKTETVLALAEGLNIPTLRVDLSEYAMPHSIHRLIGAPPSYVGYNDGALLVDFIKRHQSGVILLDEAEKAAGEVTQLFLGMMDSGVLKTQRGDTVDCSGQWMIFTTNAGMRAVSLEKPRVGFLAQGEAAGETHFSRVSREFSAAGVEATFPPEFRNRLDAVVHYRPLDVKIARDVVAKFVADIAGMAARRRGYHVTVSPSVLDHIVAVGYSERDGARALRRAVEREISGRVASVEPAAGDLVTVALVGAGVSVSVRRAGAAAPESDGAADAAPPKIESKTTPRDGVQKATRDGVQKATRDGVQKATRGARKA